MLAHEVSAYSLTAVTRAALPLMEGREGSIVTLSYLGADRVVPNYNVMGIAKAALEASVRYLAADVGPRGLRVNAISAGPIRTLSASGVKDFGTMLDRIAEKPAAGTSRPRRWATPASSSWDLAGSPAPRSTWTVAPHDGRLTPGSELGKTTSCIRSSRDRGSAAPWALGPHVHERTQPTELQTDALPPLAPLVAAPSPSPAASRARRPTAGFVPAQKGEDPEIPECSGEEFNTPSGLKYCYLARGEGKEYPGMGDTVRVDYTGWTLDELRLSRIPRFPGRKVSPPSSSSACSSTGGTMLALMVPGDRVLVTIPSDLAYGEQGSPNIGPNATLVFDTGSTPSSTARPPSSRGPRRVEDAAGIQKLEAGVELRVLAAGTGEPVSGRRAMKSSCWTSRQVRLRPQLHPAAADGVHLGALGTGHSPCPSCAASSLMRRPALASRCACPPASG